MSAANYGQSPAQRGLIFIARTISGTISAAELSQLRPARKVTLFTLRIKGEFHCRIKRNKHLMTVSEGSSLFCFPRISMIPKAGNLFYGGRRSTFAGNSALLPSCVIDFEMILAQRLWPERVSSLAVM